MAAAPNSGRRLAGWAAVVGALLAWFNVGCYVAATGGDLDLMLRPAQALALAPTAQTLFLVSMLADSFGFYLPFLIIGGYFRTELRPRFGAPIDMATLCIGGYVLLGVAGASIQIAALPPLAEAHATGDALVRAASENAWLALVHATQRGLWWMEGPLMLFWGIVIGRALLASGACYARLLIACAVLYGAYFALSLAGVAEAAELVELGMLFALPLWALLTGIDLLRQRDVIAQQQP